MLNYCEGKLEGFNALHFYNYNEGKNLLGYDEKNLAKFSQTLAFVMQYLKIKSVRIIVEASKRV